jgi:glycerol-3-phosphate dehydrogenase (NAD(P)+)
MEEIIGVIGAGGWGTALAILLCKNGFGVALWEVFPAYERILKERRENVYYLPGIALPPEIHITSSLSYACGHAGSLIVAVPSHYLRETLKKIKPLYRGQRILVATKGLEMSTGKGMMEVCREVLKTAPCALLSGPTIARELALGCPAAAVIASGRPAVAAYFQKILSCESFRLYTNKDVRGVELGGALKNVMAIGAGVIDGLGLGVNTKAAYMTRALREMTAAGVLLGAKEKTFRGLAGLGDLITTCFSPFSRNRSFGQALAEGRGRTFLTETRMVVEGVDTVKSLRRLARQLKVELPITEAIYAIVHRGRSPLGEIKRLMTRELKKE